MFLMFLGGHSPTSTSDFFREYVRAVCVTSFGTASKIIDILTAKENLQALQTHDR